MAFEDKKLVGFISIKKINAGTAEIRRFYVLPEYRRMGIGKQLYSKIMKEVTQLPSVTNLQIIVCIPFIEAINFLQKRNFSITQFDPKKLEYRMEKVL